MEIRKLALGLTILFATINVVSAQLTSTSGSSMLLAAQKFVKSLKAEQIQQTMFDFDSEERFSWDFGPLQDLKTRKYTRKGLPLEEMTENQKATAFDLLKAGTSALGFETATAIIDLELMLLAQEGEDGEMIRNPGWYFFTIFGMPSETDKWGWRMEGHHLSLNFTLDGVHVIASTPCFLGVNPAQVKEGPNTGKRFFPQMEDYARELFKSFNAEQQALAHQAKHFDDPGENPKIENAPMRYQPRTKKPLVGSPVGISGAQMTEAQKDMLHELIKSYVQYLSSDLADAEREQIKDSDFNESYFAFSGSPEIGEAYSYRVQSPKILIEFRNIQEDSLGNPNNHIHSAWRRIKGDFGLND